MIIFANCTTFQPVCAGGAFLSTPLKENGTNPRDTSSWRCYTTTPWPPSDTDTDDSLK